MFYKCVDLILKSPDSNILNLTTSTLSELVKRPSINELLHSQQELIKKLIETVFENPVSEFDTGESREIALSILAKVCTTEEGLVNFRQSISSESFFSNLRQLIPATPKREINDPLLVILGNLFRKVKPINLFLHEQPDYNLLFNFVYAACTQPSSDESLRAAYKLVINVSADRHDNSFLCKENFLKSLHQLFFSTGPKELKELVQMLLSNLSFNPKNHEILIKNGCMKIFECLSPADYKKEFDKYQLTSLVNLALHPKTFYWIESEMSVIYSLSLLDEFQENVQIKLLDAAIDYLVSEEVDKNGKPILELSESKKKMVYEIFDSINNMLSSKSLYLIKNSSRLLSKIAQKPEVIAAKYDCEYLFQILVKIILDINKRTLKYLNFQNLYLISRDPNFFENNNNTGNSFQTSLQNLFEYAKKALKALKEKSQNDMLSKALEADIIFFLKFITNCSLYGKRNKILGVFLPNKELEDFLFNVFKYAKEQSITVLKYSLFSYANMFQNESIVKFYNFRHVFEELSNSFKKYTKKSGSLEYFILAMVGQVLKSKNYNLSDFSNRSKQKSEFNDQSFNLSIPRLALLQRENVGTALVKIPTNETNQTNEVDSDSNINDSNIQSHENFLQRSREVRTTMSNASSLLKSSSLHSNDDYTEVRLGYAIEKDVLFMFRVLKHLLKKLIKDAQVDSCPITWKKPRREAGLQSPVFSKAKSAQQLNYKIEQETFLLLTNLAFISENHKLLFGTKLVEQIFSYLAQENVMNNENYKLVMTGKVISM